MKIKVLLHYPRNGNLVNLKNTKIRKTLEPQQITVIRDNREQRPWNLSPLKMEDGTLATGDYALKACPDLMCLERKELGDLISSLTHGRERFDRELQRMMAFPVKALIVESDWSFIEAGAYRSKANPESMMGSLMSIIAMGIPVIMIGDNRLRAEKWVARLIYMVAKRRYAENYALMEHVLELDNQT